MSEQEQDSNPCIGMVGDPDAPLNVATVIMAGQHLRIAGAAGPFEYRLSIYQATDIEMALVAMAHPTEPTRGTAGFRGVPVFASGVDLDGRIVDTATGRFVAILSQQGWNKFGVDRAPDHRKAALTEEKVAALKVEAEQNRRACMSDADRLSEQVAAMDARLAAIERRVLGQEVK